MRTVAFVEIDEKKQARLRKHWPAVPIYPDIKEVTSSRLSADGIPNIDVVTGGFPCQDISVAGKGAGLDGSRSSLWWELHRLIDQIRPHYAIIENVAALRSRGLTTVLQALWSIGYDAEWHIVPATSVGAHHKRERCWIVAYPTGVRVEGLWAGREFIAQSLAFPLLPLRDSDGQWKVEPDVRRVVDGVSDRVDRLKQLGDAVVPQIVETIGRRIMEDYNKGG